MAEVTEGRDQLIADANEWLQNVTPWPPALLVMRLRDALAAPVAVDEAKLAEVLRKHFHSFRRCGGCGAETWQAGWDFEDHLAHVVAEWLGGGVR